MAFARTIKGDIDPSELGVVNAHDHLIRTGAGEVYIDSDHLLIDVDKATTEATLFVQACQQWAPTGTIVDMCPANSGRDMDRLLEVNNRVPNLHVIATTGFHREKVYLETRSHWVSRYSIDQITDLLIADIEEGIDREALADSFMDEPLRAEKFTAGFGTLYTAIYRPDQKSVEYRWPDSSFVRAFDDPSAQADFVLRSTGIADVA